MSRGRCVYPPKLVTQGLSLATTLLISSLGSRPLSYFHIHKTKNLSALFISGEKVFSTNMEIMTPATGSMLPTTTDLGSFCLWFAFILVFASFHLCCLALAGHEPECPCLSFPRAPSTMMARRLGSFIEGNWSAGEGSHKSSSPRLCSVTRTKHWSPGVVGSHLGNWGNTSKLVYLIWLVQQPKEVIQITMLVKDPSNWTMAAAGDVRHAPWLKI